MIKGLSFDDVLILPQFSKIRSRKDVSLQQDFCGIDITLPIISSNMDTITEAPMADAMRAAGGVGALHRFMSIEQNVEMWLKSHMDTIVSIGVGTKELERAEALHHRGASVFLIDVAHGASIMVVEQVKALRKIIDPDHRIIVGNFATARTINDFKYHLGNSYDVDAWKIGIGGGSMCTTRIVSGCGLSSFASLLDCASTGEVLILDGGVRNSGDVAKAMAGGASMVMCGGILSGTKETPGEIVDCYGLSLTAEHGNLANNHLFKKYRGSASAESYEVQGKKASHRSAEGESTLVPYKGTVADVLEQISGGLRSALSYVGANNISEFREYAEFAEITNSGASESKPHGKR